MIRPVLERGLIEAGMELSEECLEKFERFTDELKKWNRKINLTSLRKDDDIAVKHIIDALFLVRLVQNGERVLDIGSGGGVPAIPLKIVRPDVSIVSVDAVGKKILFQRHVSRLLGLKSFEAIHSRVEALHASHAGKFDLVVSRAFSSLDMFVDLAAPLVADGGRIIAMKGPHNDGSDEQLRDRLCRSGFKISSVETYRLPMDKGERSLVTLVAVNARK